MTRRFLVLFALAPTLLAASCLPETPPLVSDTGYEGTWSRGNMRGNSIVAIVRVGDEYRFRWSKRTYAPGGEEKLVVACDWEGRCTETLNGKVLATYRFRTWVDDSTGRLHVEGVEDRVEPERFTNRFVDELVVEDGGRTLWRYTKERMGQSFEGVGRPMASFSKVSDGIADPPRELRR